ncbi:peptidoglycan-binding protein [Nostoc linckia FACHB-104]|nr:peptidoglycan-binding protein [Nostoc linckia FACHB-104]
MRLQNFYQAYKQAKSKSESLDYGVEAIASDEELATHIQQVLIELNFLDPPADGKFGPISTEALMEFQNAISTVRPEVAKEKGFLGLATAEALIETKPQDVPQPKIDYSRKDLAARLIKFMTEMNYRVSVGNQKYNIIYVEGMNPDGSLNSDRPNEFNDLRLVIEIPDSDLVPVIQGKWEGTTEPGKNFTLNPKEGDAAKYGAARIAFGQYKAWQVGTHYGSGAEPHEALVQEAPIDVYRDKDKNFKRPGDSLYTGKFEINQHHGFDYPRTDIRGAGAGCLVGRTRDGHREFMRLIKQDRRYQKNQKYLFHTTIIPGDEFIEKFPVA